MCSMWCVFAIVDVTDILLVSFHRKCCFCCFLLVLLWTSMPFLVALHSVSMTRAVCTRPRVARTFSSVKAESLSLILRTE